MPADLWMAAAVAGGLAIGWISGTLMTKRGNRGR